MRISITEIEFSLAEQLILEVDYARRNFTRRVSKSLTLDGGCVVDDYGYHATDDNLMYVIQRISPQQIKTLENMIILPSYLRLASIDGVFIGVFDSVKLELKGGLNFIISQKIS